MGAPGGAYTNLKPSELKLMLDNKDFLLIDVHTPHEGTLPQTDGRIPYDQVEQNIAIFPTDKGAKTLVRLGYTNVYSLDGGMSAWKAAGYELIPEVR
jgi:rhodanese-related sulfurtransferase